jgi:hypothetical protein
MKTGTGVIPRTSFVLLSAFLAWCMLYCSGCAGEPAAEIRKKLNIVADADFKAIIADLPKKSLSDSLHFTIVEYKDFSKGPYRVKAVVDYFYIRDIKVKRTVKYRYVKREGKWERYANDYVYY